MKKQRCPRCGVEKGPEAFYPSHWGSKGYHCRACVSHYNWANPKCRAGWVRIIKGQEVRAERRRADWVDEFWGDGPWRRRPWTEPVPAWRLVAA